jgi:hypothetical protein
MLYNAICNQVLSPVAVAAAFELKKRKDREGKKNIRCGLVRVGSLCSSWSKGRKGEKKKWRAES